jgi:hypothetical protein
MTSSLRSPVELRLGKKSRCLAENLVRSSQLAVLPLKFLHPGPLIARQSSAPTRINLGPTHPLPKRFPCLAADRGVQPILLSMETIADLPAAGRPLRAMFMFVLQHHPNCPLSYLWRIPRCSCHDSILSNFEVSGKPGAVQPTPGDTSCHTVTPSLCCHTSTVLQTVLPSAANIFHPPSPETGHSKAPSRKRICLRDGCFLPCSFGGRSVSGGV